MECTNSNLKMKDEPSIFINRLSDNIEEWRKARDEDFKKSLEESYNFAKKTILDSFTQEMHKCLYSLGEFRFFRVYFGNHPKSFFDRVIEDMGFIPDNLIAGDRSAVGQYFKIPEDRQSLSIPIKEELLYFDKTLSNLRKEREKKIISVCNKIKKKIEANEFVFFSDIDDRLGVEICSYVLLHKESPTFDKAVITEFFKKYSLILVRAPRLSPDSANALFEFKFTKNEEEE